MGMDVKDLLLGKSDSDDPPIPTLKNLFFFKYLINFFGYIKIYKVIPKVHIFDTTLMILSLFFKYVI